ncbi:hypothetical protein [Desulfovibrio litoralis]
MVASNSYNKITFLLFNYIYTLCSHEINLTSVVSNSYNKITFLL